VIDSDVDDGRWDMQIDDIDDGRWDSQSNGNNDSTNNINISGMESNSSNGSANTDIDVDEAIPQDHTLPSHLAFAWDAHEFIFI